MDLPPDLPVAVYTAIYGGYDELKAQPRIPGVDYVCFTDDPSLRAEPWRIVVQAPRYDHPRLSAKYYKALPDQVLPRHPRTVWIDGSVTIRDPNFVGVFLERASVSGLSLLPHPDRDCIYDEAEFSIHMPKYQGLPILAQAQHYRSRGYPVRNGLFACTVMARDASHRWIKRLGKRWLRENLRWTYQDQISMPYVLWRMRKVPTLFEENLWDNAWFEISTHTSEL